MTQVNHAQSRQLLSTPVINLKGVGQRVADKLIKLNLRTVEDLLYTLPLRYEDRREFRKISSLRDNSHEVFFGEILACGETTTSRTRRRLFEVIVGDGTGQVALKWFHYRKEWMTKRFLPGKRGVFTGEVKRFGSVKEVHHPEVELLAQDQSLEDYQEADPLAFGRILPVYPLTEGLSQQAARKIWKQAVDQFAPCVLSRLPGELVASRGLLPLSAAFQHVHWPENETNLSLLESGRDPAQRTLIYDEFFFLELGLALKRRGVVREPGITFAVTHKYTRPLASMLTFHLTAAQRRVLGEIKQDLMSQHPMNRLIQGDVGSGKTVVALMTALVAIENNTQVAIVAPTEILAEQHYLQFRPWLEQLGLNAVILRGKMPGGEKQEILRQVREGEAHLIIGTHAVLQEGVDFKRLGLGIIDEQHRFGVRQRSVLRQKGDNPHMLVMTATPIPRTLSLTLYGDLDLSVVDEMPPGRTPVETFVISEAHRSRAYDKIRETVNASGQVYIVFPLVEESEKSDLLAASEGAELLQKKVFPDLRIGLLHGRMTPSEKEIVMRRFKARELDILVSTTVIEVGVDVPNATLIVVEHAERFGLAQLHQLRGRVGRGDIASTCILLKSYKCSIDGEKRLEVMKSTNDGFRIAEADLEIRGPGEFLGTRQSGLPDFRIASILRDGRILEEARSDAFAFVESQTFEDSPSVLDALKERWGNRLELASIG